MTSNFSFDADANLEIFEEFGIDEEPGCGSGLWDIVAALSSQFWM
jgi:hypothetical protein